MNTKLIPLTVVVLTQNEKENISRCLNSLSQFAEILLLDSSTDNTISIAKKTAGERARVLKTHTEDFSKLRNLALSESKYEWVFFVDADENLPLGLAREIKEAIQDKRKNGYMVRRKDYFLGRWLAHGETAHAKLLKLGRRNAGKWRRRVHEVWDIKGETGELVIPLLHFPHPSVTEFFSRINRWSTMDAEEFYQQGIRSTFWKIIVFPGAKFILNYYLRLGFLDGMPGLILALMMSFHSFLTRAKLYSLQMKFK